MIFSLEFLGRLHWTEVRKCNANFYLKPC